MSKLDGVGPFDNGPSTNLLQHFVPKKSRIRETKNLSTDADSRTNTTLERLRDLSFFLIQKIL